MAQRFEGKSLDDALNQAAAAFGVERYQIRHSTLVEKRGFLGGVKRVVIEAEADATAPPPSAAAAREAAPPPPTVPIVADVPLAAVSQAEPALPRATPARPRAEGRDGGGRGTDGGGRSRGGARGERSGGRGRGGRRRSSGDDRPELRTDAVERSSTPAPEQGPQSDMAKVVRDWCEEVLDLVRLDVAVRTEENETQILVRLYGRDAGRMVERHGELLDAVQVLANKALTGRKVEKEIELDCEAFKERRTETLEQQARELAERVRRDGREQLLPAMSPVERRIIHLALQDDADVATESRGDGFFKRVAVIPRPASPAAES